MKWTPEYYVFYIDGKPTWASMGGGVSKVQEFLRLTVEIDAGDAYGPARRRSENLMRRVRVSSMWIM